VHLVGFTIEIYYDARSYKRQAYQLTKHCTLRFAFFCYITQGRVIIPCRRSMTTYRPQSSRVKKSKTSPDAWRWSRLVIPKRMYRIISSLCVKSHKEWEGPGPLGAVAPKNKHYITRTQISSTTLLKAEMKHVPISAQNSLWFFNRIIKIS